VHVKAILMAAICCIAGLALLQGAPALASSEVTAPGGSALTGLLVEDTPSDGGGSLTVRWQTPGGEVFGIVIERSASPDGPFEQVGDATSLDGAFDDFTATDGTAYYYRLGWLAGGDTLYTGVAGPGAARGNWFRRERTNALVLFLLMFILVNLYIRRARKGKELYIRRIAGLSALDEAVGRATEMGKKMFYIPGIMSLSEIQTIASLSILAHVAKQSAIYGATLEVPNTDPLTFTAARETVKQAYMEAGKPDQFKEEMVTYITYDQFAYAASVSGKMVRERPATNFLIGSFYAEALIFAETGQSIGAIQIAGTADVTQLPFFVTACDYTLMGEELYAASAYLSREPVLLGSIKAQDVVKAILLAVTGAGIIAYAFGWSIVRDLLTAR